MATKIKNHDFIPETLESHVIAFRDEYGYSKSLSNYKVVGIELETVEGKYPANEEFIGENLDNGKLERIVKVQVNIEHSVGVIASYFTYKIYEFDGEGEYVGERRISDWYVF